jgi:hypothetical protein
MLLPDTNIDINEEDSDDDDDTNIDSEPRQRKGMDTFKVSDSDSEDSDSDGPRDPADQDKEGAGRDETQVRNRGGDTGDIQETKGTRKGQDKKKNNLTATAGTFLEDSLPSGQQLEIGEFELIDLSK